MLVEWWNSNDIGSFELTAGWLVASAIGISADKLEGFEVLWVVCLVVQQFLVWSSLV